MRRFEGDPAALKDVPPFSWFTDEDLVWALPTIQHRRYPARVFIQRAGDVSDGLYILLSGRVQLVHQDPEGREFIAALVGPHDFFGELGLFDNEASAPGFRSTQPCELLYIPRAVVLQCLEENGRATMCMLRKVAKRLGAAHRKLAQLALSCVAERVADVLLENACETECGTVVHVGAEQIAALAGCSREMVSRVVKNMLQQGVARRHGRKLILVDPQALRNPMEVAGRAKPVGTNVNPCVASE
jgi:CRP/FNR family cyclic AMP-dependent transcriptional regulator